MATSWTGISIACIPALPRISTAVISVGAVRGRAHGIERVANAYEKLLGGHRGGGHGRSRSD